MKIDTRKLALSVA